MKAPVPRFRYTITTTTSSSKIVPVHYYCFNAKLKSKLALASTVPWHHFPSSAFSTSAARKAKTNAMAPLTIDSKYRMKSGYEIPVLGFGVSLPLVFPMRSPSPERISSHAMSGRPFCKREVLIQQPRVNISCVFSMYILRLLEEMHTSSIHMHMIMTLAISSFSLLNYVLFRPVVLSVFPSLGDNLTNPTLPSRSIKPHSPKPHPPAFPPSKPATATSTLPASTATKPPAPPPSSKAASPAPTSSSPPKSRPANSVTPPRPNPSPPPSPRSRASDTLTSCSSTRHTAVNPPDWGPGMRSWKRKKPEKFAALA